MKTIKAFGNYFKPAIVAAQTVLGAGIVYLVANPHALDPIALPESWRPGISALLAFAGFYMNSRHSEQVAGNPIEGRRAGDAKLQ